MSVRIQAKRYLTGVICAAAFFCAAPKAHAGVMYAITGASGASSSLYALDTSTATATLIGATGFSHVTGLAVNPVTGDLYGHVSDLFGSGATQLISINKDTGAGTVIGNSGAQIPDISFDSSGTLYGWSEAGTTQDDLVTIDLGTGLATLVDESSTGTARTGLAFDGTGSLYMQDIAAIATVDPTTGLLTSVQTPISGAGSLDNVLEFDEFGTLFTIDRSGAQSLLYTVDLGASTATLVGDIGIANISALAYDATVDVPAPGTVAILGLGLLGLGRMIRRG